MEDRLKGIEAFVQAAETGSFALAAARLRQTRSAVGKSIARLERRLGVRLFNRTTRRQSLTEAGEAYYERCRRALGELEAAEQAIGQGRREPIGRLRVTAPLLFGRRCVAPILAPLLAAHPQLELQLSFSDRVVDLIGEGFDLGIRIGRLGDSSTLAARRLGSQDFVLCASPEYLERAGRPDAIDDYASHQAIVYASAGAEESWTLPDTANDLRDLAVAKRLRIDDMQSICDAAVAGLGIARLPRWLAQPLFARGRLELLAAAPTRLHTDIHAIWPQSRHLPQKTRAAIDALMEGVPPLLN